MCICQLYTSTPTAPMGYSLLNGSTLVGGWITLADLAASGSVLITQSGNVTALLNVGMCSGFNETYNSFTGFGTAVSMVVEDYPKCEL